MREIVLDTETTGLDPNTGDRLIEIGCIELRNRMPTGREFHRFINPDRDVPASAQAVHGITTASLRDKPRFAEVVEAFLTFIGDDPLVIHNAQFDVGFLNFELAKAGQRPLMMTRVVDTLALARRRHPAGPNSLDALCKRYGIDTSRRTKHGALVDCELLAPVYIELLGERQAALILQAVSGTASRAIDNQIAIKIVRSRPLPSRLSAAEVAAHRSYVGELGPKALWQVYWTSPVRPD